MDKITVIPFKGKDINILYKKGQLGYSFEHGVDEKGKPKAYGTKVTLNGKSVMDIVSATFLLLVSAHDTIEALKNNDNQNVHN